MKIKSIESFRTKSECREYMTDRGWLWSEDKDHELNTRSLYIHEGVMVLFDCFGILEK